MSKVKVGDVVTVGADKGRVTELPGDPAGTARVELFEGPSGRRAIKVPLALLSGGGVKDRAVKGPAAKNDGGQASSGEGA